MKTLPHILLTAVICSCALTGCTRVDYGTPEEVRDDVGVSFRFDWKGMTPPEEMQVVMSRVINTLHYGWTVYSDGTVKGGITEAENTDNPDNDGNPSAGNGTETGTPGPTVINGEYFVMAFNCDDSVMMASGLQDFLTNPGASMKGICLKAAEMPEEEVKEQYGGEQTDFNPSFGFIRQVPPTFAGTGKASLFSDEPAEIIIEPAPVTQRITFRIKVETEPGVTIESVMAEISGIAGSVEIMTGEIDNENTYRNLFAMHETGTSGSSAKEYEGTISAFGLFPAGEQTYITGPGIFQITIRATDGENTKVFHAGINIRETITGAGMVEELENGNFRIARNEVVLDIPAVLKIDKGQIGHGEDQGVETWVDSDEILNVEI